MSAPPALPSPRMGAVLRAVVSLWRRDFFQSARPVARALPYRSERRRGIPPLADVYVPEGDGGAFPTALVVHGGAFLIGSRRMKAVRFLATRLVEAGIGACLVDYRLVFRGGRLAEQVRDIRDALRWWAAVAGEYGGDPAAISLVGVSAGAAISMLAAGELDGQVPLRRIAHVFGLSELDHMGGLLSRLLPRWETRSTDRAVWRDRSPLHGPQPTAPMLLVHGTEDRLVPIEQPRRLVRHREELGLKTTLLELQGQPHAYLNWRCEAAEQTAAAIVEHLTG